MKKFLMGLITVFGLLVMMPNVKAAEKVPVYMFTKDGCSACEVAKEYFLDLKKDNPDLFEVHVIEVFDHEWNTASEDGLKLLIAVLGDANEDTEKLATPTIAIGDYLTVGIQETSDLYDAIIKRRDQEKPKDRVIDIAETQKVNLDEISEILKSEEETKEEDKGGKYDALIVVGIFVVLIGGFAGLIILGKK